VSWQALAAVSDRILGSSSRKAVVICLANHANIDSELTFPSVWRISQETELAESTVRECLAWLRERKLIIQVAGPAQHRPTTYRLNYGAFADLQQVEVCRPGLQVPAPDLQQAEATDPSPPAGGARPPAGGPEQYLTDSEGEKPKETRAASRPPSRDQTLWVQVLAGLRLSLSRGAYDNWVRDSEVRSQRAENGRLILDVVVGNDYAARHLIEMGIDEKAAAIASEIAKKPVHVRIGT